mgnify:CR=1 FL=1
MERNDLDEFLAMAELGDRDFTAERRGAVVVSMGDGSDPNADPNGANAEERERERLSRVADAEATHRNKLKVPRRPPWTRETPPEVLDQNERRAFLEWRRALASVEADERLTLTPFEKNLEIWRQLWRVCERSDIVVQVVDARDPLFYRCPDLEAFVKELDDGRKETMLLLNKADLLSRELRDAWSEYFDANGIEYLWWSAKAATETTEDLGGAGPAGTVSRACLVLRTHITPIEPVLHVDKRKPSGKKDKLPFVKFGVWSTHPGSHPSHNRQITLTNQIPTALTFTLAVEGPFTMLNARTHAPKHPLQSREGAVVNRPLSAGSTRMFTLPHLANVVVDAGLTYADLARAHGDGA